MDFFGRMKRAVTLPVPAPVEPPPAPVEPPPAALTGVAESALTEAIRVLEEAREVVRRRVKEATDTTGSEVLAAGNAVEQIVNLSRSQADRLSALAGSLTAEGAGDSSVETAVVRQLDTIRTLIESLQAQTREQSERATQSSHCVDDIVVVSAQIEKLSREANILSLNASIEGSRAEPNARAFGVVAGEMRRLSREVATANGHVRDLATRLARILPAIARGAHSLESEANTFAKITQTQGDHVRSALAVLHESVHASIRGSEETVQEVIAASHDALSHLQFQDVTEQTLRCGDGIFQAAVADALRALGAAERVEELAPPEYVTLGTADDPTAHVTDADAGDVMLF
jgi:methyl-accepting chemotaxis protein